MNPSTYPKLLVEELTAAGLILEEEGSAIENYLWATTEVGVN